MTVLRVLVLPLLAGAVGVLAQQPPAFAQRDGTNKFIGSEEL